LALFFCLQINCPSFVTFVFPNRSRFVSLTRISFIIFHSTTKKKHGSSSLTFDPIRERLFGHQFVHQDYLTWTQRSPPTHARSSNFSLARQVDLACSALNLNPRSLFLSRITFEPLLSHSLNRLLFSFFAFF
jgi:hypothetical protein